MVSHGMINYQMIFHENGVYMVICYYYLQVVVSLIPDGQLIFVSYLFLFQEINELNCLLASDQFWSTVARAFGSSIKRIAFEGAIKNDDFRSPTTRLVLGNDPWVHLLQNGIK